MAAGCQKGTLAYPSGCKFGSLTLAGTGCSFQVLDVMEKLFAATFCIHVACIAVTN